MSDLLNETTTSSEPESNVNIAPEAAPLNVAAVPEGDWKSSLPDDIRNDPTLSNIKDIESLAKSHISAQRMIGGRIPIPSADASKETRDEFYAKLASVPDVVRLPEDSDPEAQQKMDDIYNRLGRPSTPDKYNITNNHNIPLDNDFLTSAKAVAHKYGLNQKQFDAMSEVVLARDAQMKEMLNKQHDNCEAFLKKEWGNTFKDNISAANGVLRKFSDKMPTAVEELRNTPAAANNPVVIMMAAELGRLYQENGTIGSTNGVRSGSRTPEQAMAQINDIMNNSKHAYHNGNDPLHESAVNKMNMLYKDAFPDEEQSN